MIEIPYVLFIIFILLSIPTALILILIPLTLLTIFISDKIEENELKNK